jgi:NAD(P)-dependent dehydrogenase (short-subunit alcohol dehydrogenase family)
LAQKTRFNVKGALIPSTFPAKEVATFGSDTPLGRAGEPVEVATCFALLASDDSSYMTGQVLDPMVDAS